MLCLIVRRDVTVSIGSNGDFVKLLAFDKEAERAVFEVGSAERDAPVVLKINESVNIGGGNVKFYRTEFDLNSNLCNPHMSFDHPQHIQIVRSDAGDKTISEARKLAHDNEWKSWAERPSSR